MKVSLLLLYLICYLICKFDREVLSLYEQTMNLFLILQKLIIIIIKDYATIVRNRIESAPKQHTQLLLLKAKEVFKLHRAVQNK